jgi:hypothetical protein
MVIGRDTIMQLVPVGDERSVGRRFIKRTRHLYPRAKPAGRAYQVTEAEFVKIQSDRGTGLE